MDELFPSTPSHLPPLEQARRRVEAFQNDLAEAEKYGTPERIITLRGCVFLAQREVARLERERFRL